MDQFGIKEVLDLVIRDYATKKPFMFIDYAQTTSNETASERLPINGGRGNVQLMSFDHSKTNTFTLSLPLVDVKMLALLGGSEIIEAIKDVVRVEKVMLVDNAGTLEANLTNEVVGDEVQAYEVEDGYGFGEDLTGVVVNGKKVTINQAGGNLKAGDQIFVSYTHALPTGTKTGKITSDTFPQAISAEGYGIARGRDERDYPVLVQIYKARPQGNFTVSMSASDATTLEITLDVYEALDEAGRKTYVDYTFINDPQA